MPFAEGFQVRLAQLSDVRELAAMFQALWPQPPVDKHAHKLQLLLEGKADQVLTMPRIIFVAVSGHVAARPCEHGRLARSGGAQHRVKIPPPMFEDLYNTIARLFSFTWTTAIGEITAMEMENVGKPDDPRFRLCVCYRFHLGDDGPYCGEGFWKPIWTLHQIQRIKEAKRNLRLKHTVPVRYRRDDPSQNRLDSDAWRDI